MSFTPMNHRWTWPSQQRRNVPKQDVLRRWPALLLSMGRPLTHSALVVRLPMLPFVLYGRGNVLRQHVEVCYRHLPVHRVLWLQVMGLRNCGASEPCRPDSRDNSASLRRPFNRPTLDRKLCNFRVLKLRHAFLYRWFRAHNLRHRRSRRFRNPNLTFLNNSCGARLIRWRR